jgi:pimeloyl-ACP methyl ester carboxylesterase
MTNANEVQQHPKADNRINQQITLADGRRLGYAEYGVPDGKPVFYFHGFPGSRVGWPAFDRGDFTARLNARIIAVDRPGYGLSDAKHGRTFLEWPDDVVELADALALERFAVLGISGGGPYASACAFEIVERLTATAIVCGMGPAAAPGCKEGASWIFPGKLAVLRWPILMMIAMAVRKNPDKFIAQMNESVSELDQALLQAHPELAKMIADDWREAFRLGIGGTHQESALYTHPWGFRLQEIAAEVHLWHGEQDNNVSGSVGHYVADAIPNCHATFFDNEGHFSIIFNHMEEILSVLVA